MKINDLHFLHFMVQVGSGRDRCLVSPRETEEMSPGGHFSAPVSEDGKLFPAYRFHFSIYLGSGKFLKRDGRTIFDGAAVAFQLERKDHLLLTFLDGLGDDSPGLPGAMRHDKELLLPMLRRVPRQAPRPYSGGLWHRDFELKLAGLEYADESVFEDLLGKCGISIIGCDPFSKYEARGGSKGLALAADVDRTDG